MTRNILENNAPHQTRRRLQSGRYLEDCEVEPGATGRGRMQAVADAVGTFLKYTGFREQGKRNCLDYRLERNDVYLKNLPAIFNGYTILHLSDLHADALIDEGVGIMRIVESVPCDIAVLTGDFAFDDICRDYKPCLKALNPIIASISAQDGIFGVLGNHDLIEMLPELGGMGVQMLLNDLTYLRRGTAEIVLAGVDDPHFYKCHDIQSALSEVTPEQFIILMSHSPEIALEASNCGVDFYLCGHTHGGQICLPGGVPMFVNLPPANRNYAAGSWKCGDMQGYTSRGTGFSLSAARFFCPPEITLHTLYSGTLPYNFCSLSESHGHSPFQLIGHAIYA